MARLAHQLVTFGGTIGPVAAPVEEWMFGVRFPVNSFDETQLVAEALTCQQAWATHLRPLHSDRVSLTKVRVASIGNNGRVVRNLAGGYVQGDWNGISTGSVASTTVLPPQTSVVVSLQSGAAGASGKGRFFLPQTIHRPQLTDLRMSDDDALAIATAARSFLVALRAAAGTNSPVVASGGSSVTGQPPANYPVIQVKVGKAFDTHRSRRGDLLEAYSTIAL